MFRERIDEEGYSHYIYRELLSNNKTLEFEAYRLYRASDRTFYYEIALNIARKRKTFVKDMWSYKVTGVGLEGLLKGALILECFELWIIENIKEYKEYRHIIVISPTCNKRFRAYKRLIKTQNYKVVIGKTKLYKELVY